MYIVVVYVTNTALVQTGSACALIVMSQLSPARHRREHAKHSSRGSQAHVSNITIHCSICMRTVRYLRTSTLYILSRTSRAVSYMLHTYIRTTPNVPVACVDDKLYKPIRVVQKIPNYVFMVSYDAAAIILRYHVVTKYH